MSTKALESKKKPKRRVGPEPLGKGGFEGGLPLPQRVQVRGLTLCKRLKEGASKGPLPPPNGQNLALPLSLVQRVKPLLKSPLTPTEPFKPSLKLRLKPPFRPPFLKAPKAFFEASPTPRSPEPFCKAFQSFWTSPDPSQNAEPFKGLDPSHPKPRPT